MKSRPIDELKQIAKAIFHNEVFTDLHIENNDQGLLFHVFMPLALLSKKTINQLKADPPGMIFEYFNKAIKKFSINGYPCFTSCQLISVGDAKIVLEILQQLESAEIQALNKNFQTKGD